MVRLDRVAFLMGVLSTFAGCGTRDKHYAVAGVVTYNGAPAAGAVVYFQTKGTETKPTVMGVVQEDGTFAMVSGSNGFGVAPGEYAIFVEWKRRIGPGSRRSHQTGPDRLQGRYADPRRPAFFATVADRSSHLPPIELVGPVLKW